MFRKIMVTLAALLAVPATAATVTANANCRAGPSTSKEVIAKLQTGDTVQVQSRVSGWTLVNRTARGCWVSSRFIIGGEGVAPHMGPAATGKAVARSAAHSASRSTYVAVPTFKMKRKSASASQEARTRYAASSRKSRRSSGSFRATSGSCPCRGGNVCIGPRGGRYCITSGGNKRYGV